MRLGPRMMTTLKLVLVIYLLSLPVCDAEQASKLPFGTHRQHVRRQALYSDGVAVSLSSEGSTSVMRKEESLLSQQLDDPASSAENETENLIAFQVTSPADMEQQAVTVGVSAAEDAESLGMSPAGQAAKAGEAAANFISSNLTGDLRPAQVAGIAAATAAKRAGMTTQEQVVAAGLAAARAEREKGSSAEQQVVHGTTAALRAGRELGVGVSELASYVGIATAAIRADAATTSTTLTTSSSTTTSTSSKAVDIAEVLAAAENATAAAKEAEAHATRAAAAAAAAAGAAPAASDAGSVGAGGPGDSANYKFDRIGNLEAAFAKHTTETNDRIAAESSKLQNMMSDVSDIKDAINHVAQYLSHDDMAERYGGFRSFEVYHRDLGPGEVHPAEHLRRQMVTAQDVRDMGPDQAAEIMTQQRQTLSNAAEKLSSGKQLADEVFGMDTELIPKTPPNRTHIEAMLKNKGMSKKILNFATSTLINILSRLSSGKQFADAVLGANSSQLMLNGDLPIQVQTQRHQQLQDASHEPATPQATISKPEKAPLQDTGEGPESQTTPINPIVTNSEQAPPEGTGDDPELQTTSSNPRLTNSGQAPPEETGDDPEPQTTSINPMLTISEPAPPEDAEDGTGQQTTSNELDQRSPAPSASSKHVVASLAPPGSRPHERIVAKAVQRKIDSDKTEELANPELTSGDVEIVNDLAEAAKQDTENDTANGTLDKDSGRMLLLSLTPIFAVLLLCSFAGFVAAITFMYKNGLSSSTLPETTTADSAGPQQQDQAEHSGDTAPSERAPEGSSADGVQGAESREGGASGSDGTKDGSTA
eukprot:TRINITY_DN22613_c0_g1_i1.p1 TRINITY_DN22613_c0_g1~~TRINITY_DN22613_c0_g1_i1.p1  ORF type:complete len:820 (-),score=181.90 TRINITY_DN22613_c0_g1_i1:112-2571(-)